MKRRALLRRSAALAAAGSVAGCLAGGSGDDRTTTTPRTTTDSTTTTTTERAEEPFETLSVGSREGVLDPGNNKPHAMRVINAADEPRTIDVQIRRTGDSPMILSRSWEFPARGWVQVDLLTPANYRIAVSVGGETAGTVDMERSRFDCNSSWTTVTVTADGRVAAETVSTAVACLSAVRDHSLRVTGRRCRSDGEPGEASVAFEDGTLDLSGLLVVPSPDYGAAVESVEWDRVDGESTLAVTVAATELSDDDGGVQCVGVLDYEATLAVDGELPGAVTVRHRSQDETRTVATVEREPSGE
jgi:hypothetical protein